MTERELIQFTWDLVDDTIEHVFFRFPEDDSIRANVYRRLAKELLELAGAIEEDL